VGEPRVVVVGSANMDLVVETARAPEAGETLLGRRFTTGFGGKGANQAVMARLAGAEVAFVASLGADAHAAQTRAELTRRGVDTAAVAEAADVASGIAQIWVEDGGTNRIVVVPGANDRLDPDHVAAAVARDRAPVVVGQLEVPQAATAAGFAAARARGATTVLNPAPAAPLGDDLLAATVWLVPNEGELAALGGGDAADDAALAAFAADTGLRLLVTLGAAGAALVRIDGSVLRAPAPVVTAVDTTGAGDAFVGTFAARLAAGDAEERALGAALRCAADSVTRLGAQSSYPDPERAARLVAGV
jgi:ribokinase